MKPCGNKGPFIFLVKGLYRPKCTERAGHSGECSCKALKEEVKKMNSAIRVENRRLYWSS